MHTGGAEIWLHSFLTSELNGRTAGKTPGTQWREEKEKDVRSYWMTKGRERILEIERRSITSLSVDNSLGRGYGLVRQTAERWWWWWWWWWWCSVGPRVGLEGFGQEKISWSCLNLNLGPSTPWPSRCTDCLQLSNRRLLPHLLQLIFLLCDIIIGTPVGSVVK